MATETNVNYAVLNVPKLGIEMAASRTPRLQPSVPEEYGFMLSSEVTRGAWTVDPDNGQPLNSAGQSLADHLEFTLKTRPHWLMPAALEDEAEMTWLSGNLTLQGQRLEQLKKFCGSEKAALVLLHEEAERFGTKAFTTVPGVKPGEKSTDKKSEEAANLSTNPWSASFKGDEAARIARIESILKVKGKKKGTDLANDMAKAAGRTVGKPLRK
jgi:hypothetical protein